MTIHLLALDHASHSHGPFSPEANAAIEGLDGLVATLADTALAADPATVVAVVSDHGFATITHRLNWRVAFVKAGLIGKDDRARMQLALWDAAGANAAVMLRHPDDAALRARVAALLEKLRADPDNGITRILEGDSLEASGGWPTASFVLAMKPGYAIGGASSGALVTTDKAGTGTHGWSPDEPEMHASFLIIGQGIAKGLNLGSIDMRQIAPTFARLLNVELPTATQAPLDVQLPADSR
jgi:hypothetical protein